jgi:hypothetical protein
VVTRSIRKCRKALILIAMGSRTRHDLRIPEVQTRRPVETYGFPVHGQASQEAHKNRVR